MVYCRIITRYLELNEEKKRKKLLTQQINPWLLDTLSSRPFTITTYSVLCCIMFAIPIESLVIEHSNSLRKLEVDGLQRVFCPGNNNYVISLGNTKSIAITQKCSKSCLSFFAQPHWK